MKFIDLGRQYEIIKDEIEAGIARVMAHNGFILGPEVKEFETQLQSYLTPETEVISCSNGTDALYMSLLALDIQPGDEVMSPVFNYIAAAEVTQLHKAKNVFVDVDSETYNMCPRSLEQKISPNTKAIVVTDLFGICADYDHIHKIARKYDVPVIEDCAQSLGSTYHNKPAGTLSPIACTSFFPAKPLGCYGDGGAVFSQDPSFIKKLRSLRDHGQSHKYQHDSAGLNARLDTLQAAVLLAKLPLFYQQEIPKRHRIGQIYSEQLSGLVKTPSIPDGLTSCYSQYTIQVPHRESFLTHMRSAGVPVAIHYPMLINEQAAYREETNLEQTYPNAYQASRHVCSLPMHPYLTDAEIELICRTVKESVAKS